MSEETAVETLEPLLEAVRVGVEGTGWSLSGLQKTTSHEFEGRWKGESTRSAYLFFHRDDSPGGSVEAFLDETSRGLEGNLSLVVDGPPASAVGDAEALMAAVSSCAAKHLPTGYRRPLTIRYLLGDVGDDPASARTEFRFKVHIPAGAIGAGPSAAEALAGAAVRAFEGILEDPGLQAVLDGGPGAG